MTDFGPSDQPASDASPRLPQRGHWTRERKELADFLSARAPLLTPVYAGAVAIVDDEGIPGRSYLVWHVIREIRTALPAAINGARTERFNYGKHVKALARRWRQDGLPLRVGRTDAPSEPDSSGEASMLALSPDVVALIGALIEGHEAVQPTLREAAQRALSEICGADVPDYVVRAWHKAGEDAHKYAHVPDKPHDPAELDAVAERFAAFEAALLAITRKTFERMDEIDDILARANRR